MPRWNSCNVLQAAPDANRLWQFEARGNFKLLREVRAAANAPLPANLVARSWASFVQPKLNVAWLPPENVFLRVVELPKGAFDETVSMVELQLEKLSPLPVTQVVWSLHVLSQAQADLQTVLVVIAARAAVEQFLGELENRKFLADRLEVPALDQLEVLAGPENRACVCPTITGNPHAALVAWWSGGVLRNVSFVLLPAEGDRVAHLKNQLAQLTWAGELEGWLAEKPAWHLIADGVAAAEWEGVLQKVLGEPVTVSPPLGAADLAARTARRAAQLPDGPGAATLLPPEFSTRYREQFHDRLWLHGLYAAGVLYVIFVLFYFCGMQWAGYQDNKVQQQVAALADSYTNAMQLQARYQVFQERENLKFAALDCWKLVADNLPDGLTLQRFGFGEGQTLSLVGTAPSDELQLLDRFYSNMEKAKQASGQPMFSPKGGEPLAYHIYQNNADWNFSLQLQNGDKSP